MQDRVLQRVFFVLTVCLAVTPFVSAQIVSPPPQRVNRQAVIRCNSRVAGLSRKTVQDPQRQVYSAPSNRVVVDYNVVEEGSYGTTTKNWSSVPGNYTFVSSTEVKNTYDAALGLAVSASLNGKQLADLKAQLTSSYNAYNAYSKALAASAPTIILETNAKGNGVFVDTGSAMAIHLDTVEVEIDPNFRSASQFKALVLNKTRAAIASLPRLNTSDQHRIE